MNNTRQSVLSGDFFTNDMALKDIGKQKKCSYSPLVVKSLSEFKHHISIGSEFVVTYHRYHPELVGLIREVTEVQAFGFYSRIKDQPEHHWSKCNNGRGFRTDFEVASSYRFMQPTIRVFDTRQKDDSILYEMVIFHKRKC